MNDRDLPIKRENVWHAYRRRLMRPHAVSFYLPRRMLDVRDFRVKTSNKILLYGLLGVTLVWSTYAFLKLGRPVDRWGLFGDKFGALNTLFTGLAFVGLVATLWHDREKAADGEAEHRQLLALMSAQVQATAKATNNAAVIASAEALRARIANVASTPSINPYGDDLKDLRTQLRLLEERIHKESETIWHFGAAGL